MSSPVQKEMLFAFHRVMLPIVRLLLRTGIGFKEFARIAKLAYVQAATEDYGIRGRPTNISRVAVMTGLTRKEVKLIREKGVFLESSAEEDWWDSNFPPSDLLHFWHTDPEFLDDEGRPLSLPMSGPGPSFTDLVRRYAGDIPPGAMRVELKRSFAIREDDEGVLTAVKRYCVPFELDINFVQTIGFSLSRLAQTILRNAEQLECAPEDRSSHFEKYVWTQNLSSDDQEAFKEFAEQKTMEFLVELDDWIGLREQESKLGRERPNLGLPQRSAEEDCGVGVYYFGE